VINLIKKAVNANPFIAPVQSSLARGSTHSRAAARGIILKTELTKQPACERLVALLGTEVQSA
jgi:hypothetical protein